jgi:hypothetical protein
MNYEAHGFIKLAKGSYVKRVQDKIIKLWIVEERAYNGQRTPSSRIVVTIIDPNHGEIDKQAFYFNEHPGQAIMRIMNVYTDLFLEPIFNEG